MADTGWEGKHLQTKAERFVGFKRLGFQALPEFWTFQMAAGFLMSIILNIADAITELLTDTLGVAITSANFTKCLFTWQGLLIVVIWAVVLPLLVSIELFAGILVSNDVLYGRPVRIFASIRSGVRSLRRFLTPSGLGVILFVLVATPLLGVGFSVRVTKDLYIPNFISDVIFHTPLYCATYFLLLAVLAAIAVAFIFIMHAVLIDDLKPSEAGRWSLKAVREHGLQIAGYMLLPFLFWTFLALFVFTLFNVVPEVVFEVAWPMVDGVELTIENLADSVNLTSAQYDLMVYRVLSVFVVLFGATANALVALLGNSYLLLRFTRCYDDIAHGKRELWPARPRRHAYLRKIGYVIGSFILIAIISLGSGILFDEVFAHDPVGVVGHRAAGTLAPENSLEGLEVAIEHGCYASEIDVQRTKDGHYVINHDDTFRRLAGDGRAPKDMTFEEVRGLRLRDTTDPGRTLQVPTLEEMLDVIKGRERLLVELKGATADRQMVDDVVAMVRERDCVGDVILISLNYDVIEYAERTYPEFDTGTLVFVSVGNVSHLTCDYVLMEEELATEARITQVQNAGKHVGVWTVNTETGIRKFLTSRADLIITDHIDLAEEIQAELDERSDLEIIRDVIGDAFG